MNREIINKIFKESNLSKKDFSKKIGVSTKTVSKWLDGDSEPLFINQKRILQEFKSYKQ